ncbi:MAG: hypothetical protein ACKV19_24715 [Verrucomicrobiales bacterium]
MIANRVLFLWRDVVDDGGDGFGLQRAHGGTVVLLVGREEVVPGDMDDLPERGGAWATRVVDGW